MLLGEPAQGGEHPVEEDGAEDHLAHGPGRVRDRDGPGAAAGGPRGVRAGADGFARRLGRVQALLRVSR